jgi:hypothetical protein
MPPKNATNITQQTGLTTETLDLVADPTPPNGEHSYSAADKAALKAKVDGITEEIEELKRQIDLKKEFLSDTVFELKQALNGKPFKDANGNVWMFSSRGKENPTHFLRRQGAQDIEEL